MKTNSLHDLAAKVEGFQIVTCTMLGCALPVGVVGLLCCAALWLAIEWR